MNIYKNLLFVLVSINILCNEKESPIFAGHAFLMPEIKI